MTDQKPLNPFRRSDYVASPSSLGENGTAMTCLLCLGNMGE